VTRRGKRQLKTGPHLWGPRRRELGISLRELEAATGINRGLLSYMENRGLQPSGDEFDKVMTALEAADKEARQLTSTT